MRALVTGWFSFQQMGATAGDLLARDVACEWLAEAGVDYDIAVAEPFTDGIDWRTAAPDQYSHLIFVCGPFRNAWPVDELLKRFLHARRVGLNLSMLDPVTPDTNPFDALWERDSDQTNRPDLVFVSPEKQVPVVGLILVQPQTEYGDRARHSEADAAIRTLIDSREMAVVPIDTRLDENTTGLRTMHEIESLIARMDVVLTTRLHGTVFAIKHGVPAVVVDAISGGGKVYAHAKTIDWPVRFLVGEFSQSDLESAFAYCLTATAREQVAVSANVAINKLAVLRDDFLSKIAADS